MKLATAEMHAANAEAAQTSLTLQSTARAKGTLTFGGESQGNTADQGDTVSISEEAKAKVATGLGDNKEAEEAKSSAETVKEKLQKRIQEIQQRLREIQADASLSEDEKKTQTQALQAELLMLLNQLNEANANEYKGGTQAKGMAQSLT